MKDALLKKVAKELVANIQKSREERIDLEELCYKAVKKAYRGFSNLELSEKKDEVIEKVRIIINKVNNESRAKGIQLRYEFSKFPYNQLKRYDVEHGKDKYSHLREFQPEILSAISKMHWRSFEYLCRHLLEINKITSTGVGQAIKDGGIDFYGVLEMNQFSPEGVMLRDTKIRIIGQAKKHLNPINESEIRKFETHRKELLNGTGRAAKKLPPRFVNSKDPTLSFIVTTSRFTRDAEKHAEKERIYLKNGAQVVEDLIKSPKASGWLCRKNGKLAFDKTSFFRSFE